MGYLKILITSWQEKAKNCQLKKVALARYKYCINNRLCTTIRHLH